MTRAKATDHWPWLVVLLLLLFLGASAGRYFSRSEHASATARLASSNTQLLVAPTAPKRSATDTVESAQPKIHHTKSKARVRVRPGESAVMGYYEIAPGKLGLTMVTPTDLGNGQVSLQVRTFELPDSINLRSRAHDILPDIYDLERTGVISERRMNELLGFMLDNNEAKKVTSPRMSTRTGQACAVQIGKSMPDGEFMGVTYALRADAIQDEEGFDLSVDYHRSGPRSEE